jgi:hypothetical protein
MVGDLRIRITKITCSWKSGGRRIGRIVTIKGLIGREAGEGRGDLVGDSEGLSFGNNVSARISGGPKSINNGDTCTNNSGGIGTDRDDSSKTRMSGSRDSSVNWMSGVNTFKSKIGREVEESRIDIIDNSDQLSA